MTTAAAAEQYLAEHNRYYAGRKYAVYNPNNRDVEDLPFIIGFNNGGSPGWMDAVLIAEDGTCLGGHLCSAEGYMYADLGILEGTRPDRHETFQKHYPDGYRMDFVGLSDVRTHELLNKAIKLNRLAGEAAKEDSSGQAD